MNWRDRYFDEGYLRRWRLAPTSDEDLTVAQGFLTLAGISPDSKVLDIACGHGRYSVAFAELGGEVTGLDTSLPLLQRARSQLQPMQRPPVWVRADMRRLPFREAFDLAAVIDAFGYFDHDGEDAAFLGAVYAVLVPGGSVLLRNPNGALIRKQFRPVEVQDRPGCSVAIRNSLDEEGRWLQQEVSVADQQGTELYERRQQIYSAEELTKKLERAGFADVRHFSNAAGAPIAGETSPRLITVGRKK